MGTMGAQNGARECFAEGKEVKLKRHGDFYLDNIQMNLQKNNNQKEKSSNGVKKEPHLPIEIYICSCRKEYSSFPALYLHNKTKHAVTLRIQQKQKMVHRTVWSGTRKKNIYEFPEESESEMSKDSQQQPHERPTISEKKPNRPTSRKRGGTEAGLALEEYVGTLSRSGKGSQMNKAQLRLATELRECLQQHGVIYKMESQGQIERMEATVENLPHMFNYFLVKYLPKSSDLEVPVEEAIDFLFGLSSWLFERGLSRSLALPNK